MPEDPLIAELSELLRDWVPRQPWFEPPTRTLGMAIADVHPRRFEVLRRQRPLMVWTPVEISYEDDSVSHHQVLIGIDSAAPTRPDHPAIIGPIEHHGQTAVAYDAFVDPRLATIFAKRVAPDLTIIDVRLFESSASNSSLIIDERFVLKLFRRLEPGANPDVELPERLGRNGMLTVPVPVAVWRKGDTDLAVVRRWHRSIASGADLAQRSLSEMLRRRARPREIQADFAPSAERLGATLGQLHTAIAEAFGSEPTSARGLVTELLVQLRAVVGSDELSVPVEQAYRALLESTDYGQVIRVHGDLELSNTLWNGQDWTIVDFEGDLTRTMEQRRMPSSPLRDVAAMVQSFHHASIRALHSWPEGADREHELLAQAWVERATDSFLSGYTTNDAVHRLLPKDRMSRDELMTLYEIDRTISIMARRVGKKPEAMHRLRSDVERLLIPRAKMRW